MRTNVFSTDGSFDARIERPRPASINNRSASFVRSELSFREIVCYLAVPVGFGWESLSTS